MNENIPDGTTVPGVTPSASPGAGHFEPGDRVAGRYRIEGLVGSGGMGIVYRARQDLTNRTVALKVVTPAFASGPLVDRFLEEIQLLARLDHPGLARIYDADLHTPPDGQSIVFFTMDLVQGVPATEFVTQNQSSRHDILRLAVSLCEAVQYAHDHGVIHCDLKPGNILVQRDGSPVVIDFGLARLAQLSRQEAGEGQPGGSDLLAGTPAYMSPEQFQIGSYEFRGGQSIDIYSLGVVIFELLSGRRPYDFPDSASVDDFRRTILFERPRRLGECIENCDPELDRTLAKAMRKDPADRYYSVASLQRALHRLLPGGLPQPEEVRWTPAPGRTIPSTRWVLDEKLGEGGVGEVWLAHHRDLRDQRVVKFCDSEEKASYLRRELTLYKLLKEKIGRHEHFVPLEEVALDEPPYYLMAEYIQASDLGRWFTEHGGHEGVSEAVRLEIVAQAADALQAAHDVGVLHRDVKPSNLLVQARADDPSSVHVWVSDFGIGQVVSEELLSGHSSGFTRTLFDSRMAGSGTQLYLAPEVAAGNESTARSDIYGLGVVLFQLLVGDLRRPVTIDWRKGVADPLLGDDLKSCLAGNPSERFAGASVLADRLRRLPERRQERQRAEAAMEARERSARRRRVLAAVAVVVGAAAAVGVPMGINSWRTSQTAWRTTRTAWQTSTLNEIRAIGLSQSPHRNSSIYKRMEEMPSDYPSELKDGLRDELIAALAMASLPEELAGSQMLPPGLLGHSDSWEWLAGPASDGTLPLWKVRLGTLERVDSLTGAPPTLLRATVSDEGVLIAGAIEGEGVMVWDRLDGAAGPPKPIPGEAQQFLVACHGSTGVVAIARPTGAVELFRRSDGFSQPVILFRPPPQARQDGDLMSPVSTPTELKPPFTQPASALGFSPDGAFLAVASAESLNVLIWNAAVVAGDIPAVASHTHAVNAIAWHPAKGTPQTSRERRYEFVTGSENGTLKLWRLSVPQTGESRAVFVDAALETRPLEEPIKALSYDAGGSHLLAASSRQLLLCHSDTLSVVERDESPTRQLSAAGFSPDGTFVLQHHDGSAAVTSRFHPGTFRIAQLDRSIEEIGDEIEPGLFPVTTRDGLFLIDLTEARIVGMRPSSHANGLAFDAKKKRRDLLVSDSQEALRLWTIPPPEGDTLRFPNSQRRDGGGAGGEVAIAWRDDSNRVVATSTGERLRVFVTSQPALDSKDLKLPVQPPIDSIALHPRGIWVGVCRSGQAAAEMWPVDGEKPVTREPVSLSVPGESCEGLAWMPPDGRLLAVRSRQAITFFETGTWRQTATTKLSAPVGGRPVIAIMSGGKYLATPGESREIKLFRVLDGSGRCETAATLRPARLQSLSALRFCGKDDRFLVAGTVDGQLQVWDLVRLRRELAPLELDYDDGPLPPVEITCPIRKVEFVTSPK